ncbi:hypothetical protein [Treponema denticola]|uniref:hypothetical protein n=1 Tax=Treponema denticola TaxID=158 RepID=UPI0020A24214|nr:hypothetical protein [Treponema denticola]UTC82642.1 hypothetical protein HGJ18_05265 [Treponema denticola]
MNMEVKFDCEELLNNFEQLGKNKKTLQKKILREILRPIKKIVKQNFKGKVLKKKTGILAKETDIFVKSDGSSGWLGTKEKRRSIRNAWWIHAANEDGYTINSKSKKGFVQFKIGDKWIKKKDSIFVQGRPTVINAWRENTTDETMINIADKILQQELNKILEKK